MKKAEEVIAWAEKYPEVKRWLAKIQKKGDNAFDLQRFCQWAEKEPHELLALKDNPASREAEQLLDDFVVDQNTGFTNSVKFRIIYAVKSFFKYNYRDLAKASGAITLEKVKPYNMPRKEDLRKLWNWALNPRDKALLTLVCSTAVAKETLLNLKWHHLEENWEKVELPCLNIPPELLKGHGRGRYKGVKQITFLTPEAKRDLLNYKEWIEAKLKRGATPEDNIFLDIYAPYKPMTYRHLGNLVYDLSKNTGVPFSLHDARRYVNTALEEIRIPPNWARKIRGRKVRGEEALYSLPAIGQLREKFKEAVPLLEFTTERVPGHIEDRLKAIEQVMESIPPEQKELMGRLGIRLGARKTEKKRLKDNSDCPDGEHCGESDFKQINESELLRCLKDGWQIVHRLGNGDLIVKR
jgi:site-specific recombinase XerD